MAWKEEIWVRIIPTHLWWARIIPTHLWWARIIPTHLWWARITTTHLRWASHTTPLVGQNHTNTPLMGCIDGLRLSTWWKKSRWSAAIPVEAHNGNVSNSRALSRFGGWGFLNSCTHSIVYFQFSSRWHLCTWRKPTWNLPHIAIMSSPLKHFPNIVCKTCPCWSDFMVALLHPLINGALVHVNTVLIWQNGQKQNLYMYYTSP